MSRNKTQSDGSTEANTDKPDSCPECNGDVYYEPFLTGGTRDAFRSGRCSGYACMDCTWSELNGSTPDEDTDDSQEKLSACSGCGDTVPDSNLRKGGCKDCWEKVREHRDREANSRSSPQSETIMADINRQCLGCDRPLDDVDVHIEYAACRQCGNEKSLGKTLDRIDQTHSTDTDTPLLGTLKSLVSRLQ